MSSLSSVELYTRGLRFSGLILALGPAALVTENKEDKVAFDVMEPPVAVVAEIPEFGTVLALGKLPRDLEPGGGGLEAMKGWLCTCLMVQAFSVFMSSTSWMFWDISFFSILAGDQLTTELVGACRA